MDLFKQVEKTKLVEVYSVLLVLCTVVLVFGLFMMNAFLNSVLTKTELSPIQTILQGIQVAAVGLLLSTAILFVFFRRIKKLHLQAKK